MEKYIEEWTLNSRQIQPGFDGVMTLEEGMFIIRATVGGKKRETSIPVSRLIEVLKEQREIIKELTLESKSVIDEKFLRKIIDRFGEDVQVHKIQEEALELALALNQMNCPTKDRELLLLQVHEELADMKIMLAQADLIFSRETIDSIVESKLKKFKEKYLTT